MPVAMKRFIEIDILRGFLLLMMVVNTMRRRRFEYLPINLSDISRPLRHLCSFLRFLRVYYSSAGQRN